MTITDVFSLFSLISVSIVILSIGGSGLLYACLQIRERYSPALALGTFLLGTAVPRVAIGLSLVGSYLGYRELKFRRRVRTLNM